MADPLLNDAENATPQPEILSVELELALSDNETVLSRRAHLEALKRISYVEGTMHQLNAEIAHMRDAIHERTVQLENAYSRIKSYRAAVSVRRRFPNEILAMIFSCCVVGPIRIPGELQTAPWNVSHVCSLWRRVALAQQDLWNDILITFDPAHIDSANVHRYTGMMREVVSRSALRLLSLQIIICNGGVAQSDYEPVSECVLLHAHRVHKLSICETAEGFEDVDLVPNALTFFQDVAFPSLRAMIVTVPIRDLPFPFRWNQLRHLKISNSRDLPIEYPRLNELLQQCILLRELSLDIPPPSSQLHGFSITLPALVKFELWASVEYETNGMSNLIEAFTIPSLTQLVLTELECIAWETRLVPLIASFHGLEKLHIDVQISVDQYDDLLGGIPNITELIIPYGYVMQRSTLKSIAKGSLVPRLTKLMLDVTEALRPHLGMLEERMDSMNSASDICDVIFAVCDGSEDKIGRREHARIKALVQRGKNLSLHSRSEDKDVGFSFKYDSADWYTADFCI